MEPNIIKIIQSYKWIKVYIKDKLHIAVKTDDLIGIQSWIEGEQKWCIDWELKDKTISCEYSNHEIWSEILKQTNILLE